MNDDLKPDPTTNENPPKPDHVWTICELIVLRSRSVEDRELILKIADEIHEVAQAWRNYKK